MRAPIKLTCHWQASGKLLDLYWTIGPVTTRKIQVLLVLQNFYKASFFQHYSPHRGAPYRILTAAFNQNQFVIQDSDPRWRRSGADTAMFKVSFAMEWFDKYIILGCLEFPNSKWLLNDIYWWQMANTFKFICYHVHVAGWLQKCQKCAIGSTAAASPGAWHGRKSPDNVQIRWYWDMSGPVRNSVAENMGPASTC